MSINPAHGQLCYSAVNRPVLERVPRWAKRVLDVGCGTGSLGREIKEAGKREVVGITFSEDEAESAERHLDRVVVFDLNTYDFGDVGEFDCIICSHVLEHLSQPENLLTRLHAHLLPGGILVVALPNILFWKQRLTFLRGRFIYTVGGLMDSTHLRFFDWRTASQLISRSGYNVVERSAYGNFPLPFVRRLSPAMGKRIDSLACRLLPGLFGWQFIIVATPCARTSETRLHNA